MAKLSSADLLDAFKEMTLLELSEFVKSFEETFDVKAAAPVAVAAAAGGPAAPAAAEVEEQDEFDVILEAAGDKKIQVIKEVRTLTSLVSLGLDVMYVTEDTTRCDPETVKQLNATAIRNGARAIVLCDTVGHATPMGTVALVKFVVEEVIKPSGEKIRLDWHGHCDRGFAIANSMAALVAGANCVHATALGIGERVGNTQMDQMLVNLKLMGIAPWDQQDLTKLKSYCEAVSKATGVPIPANYPVVGDDAFRTATGVHAAAVIKAYKKNNVELANTVYSGVPSHVFGMEQVIDIGPMSGKSNVLFWLERRGLATNDELVDRIYKRAKSSDHTLTEAEIRECLQPSKSF